VCSQKYPLDGDFRFAGNSDDSVLVEAGFERLEQLEHRLRKFVSRELKFSGYPIHATELHGTFLQSSREFLRGVRYEATSTYG
jgi:hypothetical protein